MAYLVRSAFKQTLIKKLKQNNTFKVLHLRKRRRKQKAMLCYKTVKVFLSILLVNRSLAVGSDNAKQQEECDKPVVNNIYYGSEPNNLLKSGKQGLPGKRGPIGEKGQKVSKFYIYH